MCEEPEVEVPDREVVFDPRHRLLNHLSVDEFARRLSFRPRKELGECQAPDRDRFHHHGGNGTAFAGRCVLSRLVLVKQQRDSQFVRQRTQLRWHRATTYERARVEARLSEHRGSFGRPPNVGGSDRHGHFESDVHNQRIGALAVPASKEEVK